MTIYVTVTAYNTFITEHNIPDILYSCIHLVVFFFSLFLYYLQMHKVKWVSIAFPNDSKPY